MDEIIQIKCPFDGAVLSVRNQPGLERKSVTCPVCKNKYPFTKFRRVVPGTHNVRPGGYNQNAHEEPTQFVNNAGAGTSNPAGKNFIIGVLNLVGTSITHRLVAGRNVIGRKGSKSEADFQIDTGEKRSMSREHIVIEVKNVPAKGFVHYLSLYKERVNPTYIGEEQLLYGDCVIINNGDIIRLPDAVLKFEIPDLDKTELH